MRPGGKTESNLNHEIIHCDKSDRVLLFFSSILCSMEFSTHYVSFLNDISRENLEMTESTAFHVDLPSAKIREKDA